MPYDVFLSHNGKDKPLVRPLYAWLNDKLGPRRIFFDERELGLGDVIAEKLDGALSECDCALVCFGPKGTGPWHEQEIWSLLTKAIERSHHGKDGEDFRLIPVLLEGANPDEIPYLYRTRIWADFRRGLEGQETTLDRLLSAILGKADASGQERLRPEDNPYMGLEPFTEGTDSQGRESHLFFCGRDAQSRDLAARLAKEKLVLISGASGNGKSSLARAGLKTPAADQGCEKISQWSRLYLTPGHDFFFSVCNALVPRGATLRDDQVSSLMKRFAAPASSATPELPRARAWAKALFEALCIRFPNRETDRVLVIVDQLEELFTQQSTGDTAARSREVADVLEALQHLATDPAFRDDPRFHFVLTLRSEFRFRCQVSERFWAFVEAANALGEKPRHLELDELDQLQWREAIKGPAERAGAYFAPGLVGAILKDIYRQRGSMPLLQHALQQLWLKAEGACLNLAAYETSGGVSGALAKSADQALEALCKESPKHEAVCRSIFLRLIAFGAGVPDTRRRALTSELDFGSEFQPIRDSILAKLQTKDCRLLSRDGDAIEVTHEALIRESKLVIRWLEEARSSCDLPLFRELNDAALRWVEGGRNRHDLWPRHRIRRFHDTFFPTPTLHHEAATQHD